MITLAETAGFCFGVSRALRFVEDGLAEGKKMATLGPIIHNERVVAQLADRGVRTIESPEELSEGETLVIRSHGISKQTVIPDNVIDATCPFVKKIQTIVEKYHKQCYTILVAGDASHPEVIGINGWCDNSAIVIGNMDEAAEKLQNVQNSPLCVVAQTTASTFFWNNLKEFIKNTCQTPMFFDTICNATEERQKEAASLAGRSDVFFVVGGKHSSNNKKLVEVAEKYCSRVYHVEGKDDLPEKAAYCGKRIGVTAGASTPDWIIKEVLHTMEENTKVTTNINEEENWAEVLENTLVTLHTGEKVKGTVVGIHPNEVIVNLNYKSDGIIPASELTDDPTLAPEDVVKVGDVIDVFVIRVNDVEGTVLLSKKKIDNEKKYEVLEEAMENGTVLSGIVIEAVKGGVIVLCEGIRVFVPASQANDRFLSDLSVLVNPDKKVPLKIIRMDRRAKRIVGSIKQVMLAEKAKKAEAFLADAEVGKEYTGVVKTLTDFGAFVDIGGVEGLVHISQLSWSKIKHPSEVLSVGDEIKVRILKIETDENGKSKISLGYKKDEENPWVIAKSKFEVGNVVNVTITNVTSFGAFAELIPGVEGLIHISQIANKRIDKPSDELSKGQKVDAQILDINWDAKPTPKIALSIRALLPDAPVVTESVAEEAAETTEAEEEPTEYTEENPATMAENMPEIPAEEN